MARLDLRSTTPAGAAALIALDRAVASTLGDRLVALVKLRASQINGCGYCVDAHAAELDRLDYPHRKKDAVAAWRHTELFDEDEQVALAFTDALTGDIDDIDESLWDRAGQALGEQGRADLILAVGAINTWNMIGLAGHMVAR